MWRVSWTGCVVCRPWRRMYDVSEIPETGGDDRGHARGQRVFLPPQENRVLRIWRNRICSACGHSLNAGWVRCIVWCVSPSGWGRAAVWP